MRAVSRYKVLLAGITVVGTLAGLGASRLLKPVYQARATIWIQVTDRDADRAQGQQGPIQSAQLLGTPGGWLDLIRSHVVLDDVVRDARLYLTVKLPADTQALATLSAPGEVRPGTYRLEVDTAGQDADGEAEALPEFLATAEDEAAADAEEEQQHIIAAE